MLSVVAHSKPIAQQQQQQQQPLRPRRSAAQASPAPQSSLSAFQTAHSERRLRCAGEESRLHLIEKNSHDEADPDTLSASLPSSRRQLITRSASVLAVASWGAASADLAFAKVPSGFNPLKDVPDNYAFLYPFGWSEVQVDGQDVVFKDVIEPLESVSVSIIPTETKSLSDLGSPEKVGPLFVDKVLTTPGQEYKLLAARSRDTEGKTYYTFEFAAKTPTYVRHGLATVSIRNNRFYCLVTGANERRWQKVKDRLTVVADSFINII